MSKGIVTELAEQRFREDYKERYPDLNIFIDPISHI